MASLCFRTQVHHRVGFLVLFCLLFLRSVEGKPLLVCDHKIRLIEMGYGLPEYLLCAVTFVESGTNHPPWLLNANGFPFTLNSKEQAVRAVNVLKGIGLESIDVGLAQINLKHHPKAFANLENAFEPDENLAYAAKFLLDLKKRRGSWEKAICAYHSSTPGHGVRYKNRVMRAWRSFLGKTPNLQDHHPKTLVLTHQKRLMKLKKNLTHHPKNGHVSKRHAPKNSHKKRFKC